MATLASSQVDFNFGLLSNSGFPIEVYRIQGGAAADTAAITPNRFDLVKAVIGGPFSNNLPTGGTGATNVTLTLRASAATTESYDVWLVGFQRN